MLLCKGKCVYQQGIVSVTNIKLNEKKNHQIEDNSV